MQILTKAIAGTENNRYVCWIDPTTLKPAVWYGRYSKSGLTHYIEWVQKGATMAWRYASCPREIAGAAAWSDEVIVFGGHGTAPYCVRRLDGKKIREYVADWEAWRIVSDCYVAQPRLDDSEYEEEFNIARRATKNYLLPGRRLTTGEFRAINKGIKAIVDGAEPVHVIRNGYGDLIVVEPILDDSGPVCYETRKLNPDHESDKLLVEAFEEELNPDYELFHLENVDALA